MVVAYRVKFRRLPSAGAAWLFPNSQVPTITAGTISSFQQMPPVTRACKGQVPTPAGTILSKLVHVKRSFLLSTVTRKNKLKQRRNYVYYTNRSKFT